MRATKGQHKALEQLDKSIDAPKRRGKKGKKSAPEPEEPEEEVIRCVCGATEQDEDSGEPWIACDQCGAWQHNICMGMSQYSEDLPSEYFCEECRPENHKELLDGLARGVHVWEARRKAYEEEEDEGPGKKRRKGPKKGKGKRLSDSKDSQKQSPAPESKKEAKGAAGKRKTRDESQDKETTVRCGDRALKFEKSHTNAVLQPSQKMRKVSEAQSVPIPVYDAPADLPAKISELPDIRQNPAKALLKSLTHSISVAEKKGSFTPSDGMSTAARAEKFAIQIERAVQDTHPGAGAYKSQVRTLTFNLKHNQELANGLLNRTLTPPMLAVMTTEELASKEQQRENAEMKARAEKQSILITEDAPRVRRTHKGEEMVGDDNFAIPSDETPGPSISRRQTARRESNTEAVSPEPEDDEDRDRVELPAHYEQPQPQAKSQQQPPQAQGKAGLHIETKHSPRTDFDINKVFSSVKSPTGSANRRPSNLGGPAGGPGVDPEVDRMLQDDGNESPPYSPSEETDPNVVWRGDLIMNTISNFHATARYVGGAKLAETIGLPWSSLVPKRLSVAGRIDEQKAIEYLCSLRYSVPTDVVVLSLEPVLESSKPDFQRLIDYFVTKKRYGVIGDKGVANVRDTYLVPVLPGTRNQPEFMLNLVDNFIPESRSEPMLLAVFVYRNDPSTVQRLHGTNSSGQTMPQSPVTNTPTPAAQGGQARSLSIAAPAFSPTSPQGAFPGYQGQPPRQSLTPIQPPQVPHNAQHAPHPHGGHVPGPAPNQESAQRQGEQIAREVLGPFISSPTVSFLLPQAHRMSRKEWEVIRRIYERDTRTREDLAHLSTVLEKENSGSAASPAAAPAPAPAPAQVPAPAQGHAAQAQTPVHPPVRPQRNTPIPPPPIPPGAAPAGPPRQTPIPPPPIPPHATAAAPPA